MLGKGKLGRRLAPQDGDLQRRPAELEREAPAEGGQVGQEIHLTRRERLGRLQDFLPGRGQQRPECS